MRGMTFCLGMGGGLTKYYLRFFWRVAINLLERLGNVYPHPAFFGHFHIRMFSCLISYFPEKKYIKIFGMFGERGITLMKSGETE